MCSSKYLQKALTSLVTLDAENFHYIAVLKKKINTPGHETSIFFRELESTFLCKNLIFEILMYGLHVTLR